MITVNLTVELEDEQQAHHFKFFIESQVSALKDYQILADTRKMNKEDKRFKKINDAYKKARKIRNDYINENNQR